MVFKFTAKADKWFLPLVAAAVLIPLALTVVAFLLWGWITIPLGIMITLLARADRAQPALQRRDDELDGGPDRRRRPAHQQHAR